jgi:hypothetical protein
MRKLEEDSARSYEKEAGVAELVDARDSKSRFFGSMGSIPIAGIFREVL